MLLPRVLWAPASISPSGMMKLPCKPMMKYAAVHVIAAFTKVCGSS